MTLKIMKSALYKQSPLRIMSSFATRILRYIAWVVDAIDFVEINKDPGAVPNGPKELRWNRADNIAGLAGFLSSNR